MENLEKKTFLEFLNHLT